MTRTVRVSQADAGVGNSDWKRVEALSDAEIEAAIDSDPDAAPRLDEAWFRSATLHMPSNKAPVSLRLDTDVTDWFRGQGRGWQTRMNAVLRAYAQAHGLK